MKQTPAAQKRAELIAKAKASEPKTIGDDVLKAVEKAISYPKLSSLSEASRFCMCLRDRLIFENDVNTMHAPCPKCGAVMQNISVQAANNVKAQWDRESKSR